MREDGIHLGGGFLIVWNLVMMKREVHRRWPRLFSVYGGKRGMTVHGKDSDAWVKDRRRWSFTA